MMNTLFPIDGHRGDPLMCVRDESPPYQRHSETSRDAAEAAKPTAAYWREQVYEFIRSRGECGAIDDDIYAAFPEAGPNTLRPRRIDLCSEKYGCVVVDSGRKRFTKARRQATVWVAREARQA